MAVLDLDAIPDDLAWTQRRALVLARDGYVCQYCDEPATHVDHKWPQSWGGTDELDNLQALCGPCNKAKADKAQLRYITESQAYATWHEFIRKAVSEGLVAAKFRCIDRLFETGEHTDGIEAHRAASPVGTLEDAEVILDWICRSVRARYPEPDPIPVFDVGQIVHVTGYGRREFRVRSYNGGLVEAVDLYTGGLRTLRREDVHA